MTKLTPCMRQVLLLASLVLLCLRAHAQPVTYQGMLKEAGIPVTGAYDLQFLLFTAASGGSQVGSTLTVNDHPVQFGLFSVELNFGNVWDGSERYLEIQVRAGASTGAYTTLAPRVKINPTPYAFRAGYAERPWQAVGGSIFYNDGNVGIGTSAPVSRLQIEAGFVGDGIRLGGVAPNAPGYMLYDGGTQRGALGLALANGQWGADAVPGDVVLRTETGRLLLQNGAGAVGLILSGNKVGIGTSSPAYPLHVVTGTGESAVYGHHTAPTGTAYGVFGRSVSNTGTGVFGAVTAGNGTTNGVLGFSASTSGRGVAGSAGATSGQTYGVWGQSASTSGTGVYGWAHATSGTTYGGRFESNSTDGIGVYGSATAPTGTTYGVYGQSSSTSGTGVYGSATATSGFTYGVYGQTASGSLGASGVFGVAASPTGTTYGVYGRSDSAVGTGVFGYATANSSFAAWGGRFESDSTAGGGVFAQAKAHSGLTYGVLGVSNSPSGSGVVGFVQSTSGGTWGVGGITDSSDSSAYGVFGTEPSGGAGHAVFADGSFAAAGTKSFQMDHPLRPETRYLNHFCAEGPEPYNLYRGTVVLDARGEAWVQLPDYFEAINRDPTYHLTPIGAPMPNLHIAQEVYGNRFKIAGGVPSKKVSWEVKAIRNDRWVQQYGYQTEQEKEDAIKGKYLNPELYGQPKELGIHYRPEVEPQKPIER